MMKRLVSMMLLVLVLAGSAVALDIEMGKEQALAEGIQIHFDSAEVLPEWKGETSTTHKWIILWFTLTNFRKETFDASSQLEVTLEYPGGYAFSALTEIEPTAFEPLVAARGAFVFLVPNLVAEADPGTLGFTLRCEGEEFAFHPNYKEALSASGPVFCETPAEAVRYFHGCVAAGDFQGALSVMATQAMAEGYDYSAYINRIRALTASSQMLFPDTSGDEYMPLNQIMMEASLTRQLYNFLAPLLVGPGYEPYLTYPVKDSKVEISGIPPITVEEFIGRFDPARLSGLSLRYLAQLNSDTFNSERHQENLRKQGAIYGFVEQLELLAVYGFEERNWVHGYTVAKFEQGWQIISLNAVLSGMSAQGNVVLIDEKTINEYRNSGDYLLLFENP